MYTLMAELDDPLMFTHLWPSSAFTMSPTASPVKLTSLPFRARLADTRTPTRVSMTTLSSSVREFPSLSRDSKRSESEPISTVPPVHPRSVLRYGERGHGQAREHHDERHEEDGCRTADHFFLLTHLERLCGSVKANISTTIAKMAMNSRRPSHISNM